MIIEWKIFSTAYKIVRFDLIFIINYFIPRKHMLSKKKKSETIGDSH